MKTGEYNEAELLAIQQMRDAGANFTQIAERLNRSPESVRRRWARIQRAELRAANSTNYNTTPTDVSCMQQTSAATSFVTDDRPELPPVMPLVTETAPLKTTTDYELTGGYAGDLVHPSELWRQAELDAVERIKRLQQQQQWHVRFPTAKPVGIAFISDQHIAPGTPVDFERMRQDAEIIRDTPGMYAMLIGDAVDNHIKHRAAVLSARSKPDDQYKLFEHYLSVLGDKTLAVVSGNHDLWTEQFAGIDMIARLLKGRRVAYAPHEARITVYVAGQAYKIALRHQYRMHSSFNVTHSHKQWLRLGEEEFDIGAIGHTHESAIEAVMYRRLTRWLIRPGSYQINTAYGAALGFNDSIPTCPTVLLYPGSRRIVGYHCLREAAESLYLRRA